MRLRVAESGRYALPSSGLVVLIAVCLVAQPQQTLAQNSTAPGDAAAQAVESAPAPYVNDAKWRRELAEWREQRERQVDAPDGWLSLVGMEWLKPGVNAVGAADDNQIKIHAKVPDHLGKIKVSGKSTNPAVIELLAPDGGFPPDLQIDGKPAKEGPLTIEGTPSIITWHELTMVVLNRGGRFLLSIKDADSAVRTSFHGLNWYAPDPKYRVRAVWTPYTPPRTVKIPTILGTTLDFPSPGFVEFVLDGKPMNLEPVTEPGEDGTLFFILKDVTSQITTYSTARYLHTGLPDHGIDQPGLLTLDFNKLENPPCAYTTYASCPLPPDQNQLPVAIEAGEQLYSPH